MIHEPESKFKIAHSLEAVDEISYIQHQGCIVCSLELMEVEEGLKICGIDYFDLLDLACLLRAQSTPPPNC